jgi:hypothetical protein
MASIVARVPERILAFKPCEGDEPQYLVKFRGLSLACSSWLTTAEINNEAMVYLYRQVSKLDEPIPSSSSSSSSSSSISRGENKEGKNQVYDRNSITKYY